MTAGPTGYRMTQPSEHVQVRTKYDGALDEIVAKHATVHLEQMSNGHWWLSIKTIGDELHVNLHSDRRIRAVVWPEALTGPLTNDLPEPAATTTNRRSRGTGEARGQ